jgi:tRNA-dihydrouridine synthase B
MAIIVGSEVSDKADKFVKMFCPNIGNAINIPRIITTIRQNKMRTPNVNNFKYGGKEPMIGFLFIINRLILSELQIYLLLRLISNILLLKIGNILFTEVPLLLAPMEDITDGAFRQLCKRYGADIVFTEFISSEGLIRNASKSTVKLDFQECERPIAIQIFGHDIESMKKAAEMAAEAQPDFIDINFGCPVRKVVSKGAGAALLRDPDKMIQITNAVINSTSLPVTVKTRLGWDEHSKIIVDLAERLQDTGIAAISIHGRTRAQLYTGIADWTLIGEVKNNPRMHIPIIGNGDIKSGAIAAEMLSKYGVDGLMIGRAAVGNPWIFRDIKNYLRTGIPTIAPTLEERVSVCREHVAHSCRIKGEKRGIPEMRKHYSGYFRGVNDFKETKMQLLTAKTIEEINEIFSKFSSRFQ